MHVVNLIIWNFLNEEKMNFSLFISIYNKKSDS